MMLREFITLISGTVGEWPPAALEVGPPRIASSSALKRREFLVLAGLAGLNACPARGRQRAIPHIGILMPSSPDDAQMQARVAALTTGLQELGWTQGHNIQIDVAWDGGNSERAVKNAKAFADASIAVIVANGTTGMIAARSATRSIPTVFAVLGNPVGAHFVQDLAHPGGNATGFSAFEPEIVGKWIELLKEIVPHTKHVSILHYPGFEFLWRGAEVVASTLDVRITKASATSGEEIRTAISGLAGKPDSALVVLPAPFFAANRQLIVRLAGAGRTPAVYPFEYYPKLGGLVSYGIDAIDIYRRAAEYVDRILKGEKPTDLPVQTPNKFELVINLKAARALGLTIPPMLLARADEVIE